MITLIPMSNLEFQNYCQRAIAEYAHEHVRSGRWSAIEAVEQATREYQQLLPDGPTTPNHYLYTLHDPSTHAHVGMLWFAVREQAGQRSAFIYDVFIDPEFRRQGYATQTLQALENQVRALGLATIGLHVFGHNHEARAMYEKLGYVPTNILMTRFLEVNTSQA